MNILRLTLLKALKNCLPRLDPAVIPLKKIRSMPETASIEWIAAAEQLLLGNRNTILAHLKRKSDIKGKIDKYKVIDFDAFRLLHKHDELLLLENEKTLWRIDSTQFGGSPVLQVTQTENEDDIEIVFDDAYYPGTQIPASLKATISQLNGIWQIRLRLKFGGFDVVIPLSDWLNQTIAAVSVVHPDLEACPLGTASELVVKGIGLATFSPTWLLTVYGVDICQLSGQATDVTADVAVIALLDSNGTQYVLPKAWPRTGILFFSDKQFPLLPEFSTTAPRLHLGDFSFDALALEAGLDASTNPWRVLFAQSISDPVTLGLETGGDLYGSDGNPFRIPLLNPRYLQVFDHHRHRVASGLLAYVTDQHFWMHSPGISLQFTRYRLGVMGMLEATNLPLQVFCRVTIVKTAPRVEDMLVRPEFLGKNVLYFTWRPLPPPVADELGLVEIDATTNIATILLPKDTSLSIVRRDDFLALGYEWNNLRLETKGKQRRLLQVESAESYLAVLFQPQSVGEQTFFQANPKYEYREADIDKLGLTNPAKQFKQPDDNDDAEPTPPPVKALLAKSSRLVFKIKGNAAGFQVTKDTLLDWNVLTPSLAPTALPRTVRRVEPIPWVTHRAMSLTVPITTDIANITNITNTSKKITKQSSAQYMYATPEKTVVGNIRPPWIDLSALVEKPEPEQPTDTITQIELPFRLILSPNKYGAWVHSKHAVAHDNRNELWHTRLATRSGGNIVEGPHFYRTVRAIWSRDHDIDLAYNEPFLMPMDQNDRWQLVHLTADFKDPTIGTPEPVTIYNMMLTALGGWLDSDVKYKPLPGSDVAIENWRHRATMGRDHYVRIIYKGFLFPFGHRASLIKISERKIELTDDKDPVAYLRQRMFLVVREPERTYTGIGYIHESREMPLKRVRITTLVTPDLNHPIESLITGYDPNNPMTAFVPKVSGTEFKFHIKAWDYDDHEIDFSMPLAFFRSDVLGNTMELTNAVNAYNNAIEAPHKQADIHGQQVAFAESSGYAGKTTFDTSVLRFEARKPNNTSLEPPCYPCLTEADITLTALRQLTNNNHTTTIKIDQTYLDHGFDSPSNMAGLFAEVSKNPPALDYNTGSSAERSGGVATPSILVKGLSRELGTVSYTTDTERTALAAGNFHPNTFFSALDANLLGGISLKDILGVLSPGDFLSNAPKTITENSADALNTTLTWETNKLITKNSFFNENNNSARLSLSSTIKTDKASDKTTFDLKGTLDNFGIDLAGVIKVNFIKFEFNSTNGKKPDVHVDIKDITFTGALEFVNRIQDYLSTTNFIDPPYLDVTPSGITAGYNLTLPSIGVGVFSLQNLALGARMTLPFTGEPMRLRFNLSERQSPFIVSVGIFGGGGFFAIAVGMDGVETLEVSLEFGGNVSIDLGVASGGVYVMAGIYFHIEVTNDTAELTGYLRAGGSLSVLGIITVSMEFYLGLTYDTGNRKAWGEARVTVEVEVLFFSASVEVTMRRQFAGSAGDPPFAIMMPQQRWSAYAEAFA
ncbi:MAG: outer membrane channel [Gammaproteobacteria bacterium SG8_11]|nr:MAG: outer membrane channel [Gammaproteobacteria bacterium SG8_11]